MLDAAKCFETFAVLFFAGGICSVLFGALIENEVFFATNRLLQSKIRLLMGHGAKILEDSMPLSKSSFQIHKSFFWHFYAAGLLWIIAFGNQSMRFSDGWRLSAIFCLMAHLLRRLIESKFLFRYSAASRMHAVHYFVGLAYYPIVGRILRRNQTMGLLRIALFGGAFACQMIAHWQIAALKRGKAKECTRIPTGGCFDALRCWNPHYFFEICLWASLTFDCLGGLNFAWTIANLSVSAYKTKHFYEKRCFLRRAAIIPFVF